MRNTDITQADKEDKRKVTIEEGEEYSRENGIIHMQTSAKTAMNVKELFLEIAKRMPKQPKEDPRAGGCVRALFCRVVSSAG
jgi:hypothetical protein